MQKQDTIEQLRTSIIKEMVANADPDTYDVEALNTMTVADLLQLLARFEATGSKITALDLRTMTEAEFNRLPTAIKNYHWARYQATNGYERVLSPEAEANIERLYLIEAKHNKRQGSVAFKEEA